MEFINPEARIKKAKEIIRNHEALEKIRKDLNKLKIKK